MKEFAVPSLPKVDDIAKQRELEAVFRVLVSEWKSGRGHSSCIEDMSMDMPYQKIIGLGPEAIPLLLGELERNPDHWFWALHAITRHDPVPEESSGNIGKMAAAWIEWGKLEKIERIMMRPRTENHKGLH